MSSKTLLLFLDGSAVSASRGKAADFSNVFKLHLAFDMQSDIGPQIVHYMSGVGTRGDRLSAATGRGMDEIVKEAYVNLASNFEDGDTICLFGFSRGAAAARALASMVSTVGLLHAAHLSHMSEVSALYELYQTPVGYLKKEERSELENLRGKIPHLVRSPRIRLLALFDTVSGSSWDRWRIIHKTAYQSGPLERGVEVGIHLLSTDDRRRPFIPQLWTSAEANQVVEQIWMPGVHSDIGGTSATGFLCDIALVTMIDRIQKHVPELRFSNGDLERISGSAKSHRSVVIADEMEWPSSFMRLRKVSREIGKSGGNEMLHPITRSLYGRNFFIRHRRADYDPHLGHEDIRTAELGSYASSISLPV